MCRFMCNCTLPTMLLAAGSSGGGGVHAELFGCFGCNSTANVVLSRLLVSGSKSGGQVVQPQGNMLFWLVGPCVPPSC